MPEGKVRELVAHEAVVTAGRTSPTVAIVIRAKNEVAHLPRLLASISKQSVIPDEVIVVDSGSSDGTDRVALEWGARVVRIEPELFTFGRALNIGCEASSSDLLVFASAHVYPEGETWLADLLSPLTDSEKVVLSYGRQTGDVRTHFSEFEIMRRWYPLRSTNDQKFPFCNNANCAIRRSEWAAHRYDEALTGLEDIDWAARALQRGGRIAYAASATVVHVHEEAFAQTVERYRREAIAYRRVFSDERLGIAETAGLLSLNIGRDLLSAARRRVLYRNARGIVTFRAAQFSGAYLGFRHETVARSRLKRRFYYPKGFSAWERSR